VRSAVERGSVPPRKVSPKWTVCDGRGRSGVVRGVPRSPAADAGGVAFAGFRVPLSAPRITVRIAASSASIDKGYPPAAPRTIVATGRRWSPRNEKAPVPYRLGSVSNPSVQVIMMIRCHFLIDQSRLPQMWSRAESGTAGECRREHRSLLHVVPRRSTAWSAISRTAARALRCSARLEFPTRLNFGLIRRRSAVAAWFGEKC
jgi:hypothetical protein